MAETTGRDRLRELLDAVLDDDHRSLTDMAGGAYSSPYHFARRQDSWFRKDPRITWVGFDDPERVEVALDAIG